VLEAFNGEYFFNLPDENSQPLTANRGMRVVYDNHAGINDRVAAAWR